VPIVNGVVEVSGDDAKELEVDLKADGFWMPQQRLTISLGALLPISVWRTTSLRGHFSVQSRGELPKTFAVEIQPPPGTAAATVPAATTFDCPVGPDASWQCAVPAVTLDVVIRAKTFIPNYAWDLKLKTGVVTDLGVIVLKHGASFIAWLDRRTSKSLKVPARAHLIRMVMANSPTLGSRLSQSVADGVFNPHGVVQLAPVPPGTYTLEVTASGFAPARLDEIKIYEGRESALRLPIVLEPPVNIRLSIDPPHDPTGAPWRVTLVRRNELTFRGSAIAEGSSANGIFEAAGQAHGHYVVIVKDRNGNWYANRDFDIQNAADAQRTIDIGALRVHGKVVVANEPIGAHLVFGGRSGEQRVSAVADDDGSFNVVLPRSGKWAVDVESKQAGIFATVTTTVATNQHELEIDLPDTEVAGWVTGLDGNRVAGAIVTFSTTAGVISRRTEPDGTFRFRGVSEGTAHITASDQRSSIESRFLEIPISEGLHREDLELILENPRTLKGEVAAQGQPVVGARIDGYGFGTGMARQQRAVSDLDGGFELSFPESSTEIALIVAAAGHPLQAFSTPPSEAPIVLDLSSVGGVLRLSMPAWGSRPGLRYNGIAIPMAELLEWARAQGSSLGGDFLEIPNVAAGLYQFCVARSSNFVCKDGKLAPGSVLALAPD